jgi:hypothetical protein
MLFSKVSSMVIEEVILGIGHQENIKEVESLLKNAYDNPTPDHLNSLFKSLEIHVTEPQKYRDVFFSCYGRIDGTSNTEARREFCIRLIPTIHQKMRSIPGFSRDNQFINEIITECLRQYDAGDRLGALSCRRTPELYDAHRIIQQDWRNISY